MVEAIKTFYEEMMDLEKQYSLLVFSSIVLAVSRISKVAFESIKDKFSIAFISAFPKANSILNNLFSTQFIYDITELLVIFSGISVVLFGIIITIQLVCKHYLNAKININGTQYTFDIFLGKFAVTSINLYIFICLILSIFNTGKIFFYVPEDIIGGIGFAASGMISLSTLLGLFIYGKLEKVKNRN